MANNNKSKKGKVEKFNRWGYIFLIPFLVVYVIFNLIPLGMTIYYSFYEYFRAGLYIVGPNWIGFDNYKTILSDARLFIYARNTLIMWILGFIPQILISLLLAQWFSDQRLKIKGSTFFKSVIYMPNLIMASAFAMLFFALFSDKGPINEMLVAMHILDKPFSFFTKVWPTRILVATMNFLMWFGNTTILLMAGIMSIDYSLYEAAEVDGATSWQRFTRITLPLLKPIFVYVLITSLIGGIQMFDVPSVLTGGTGMPKDSTMTLIMFLSNNLTSKNFGLGGAISIVLFILTSILSMIVYFFMYRGKAKEA